MAKRKKRKKKNTVSPSLIKYAIGAFVVFALYVIFFHNEKNDPVRNYIADKVEQNYGSDINKYAEEYGYNPAYFKALVMLECSGKKEIIPRFESHVYERLVKVREGKRAKYESVTHLMIESASDDALKNLASSWGPFQIMGYKCVQLGVNVHDLRSEESVRYGIKWIDLNYGSLLKQGRYKDAFHFHNTGRLYPKFGKPKTYDPDYVTKGLMYMELFD